MYLGETKQEYLVYFRTMFGSAWDSMTPEKKAVEWGLCMEQREFLGKRTWTNPWKRKTPPVG